MAGQIKAMDPWRPRQHQDRPTAERRAHGEWFLDTTDIAGVRVARDAASTPLDRLHHVGVISNDQWSAGRDYENLYVSAQETAPSRDSCMTWEPKGHDNGDGPVAAARDRKELYLMLGTNRDVLLRHVCVYHNEPRDADIGPLREALNECARFFKI